VAEDKYANILYERVIESSANTLTFKAISLGASLFDKIGILISRVEFYQHTAELAAVGDTIQFGLSASNSWAVATPAEGSIITLDTLSIADYGTAGNNQIFITPLAHDFGMLPGNGLLIAPKPLYLFVVGASLPNPGEVRMRLYFTIKKLSDSDFFELLETRHYFA